MLLSVGITSLTSRAVTCVYEQAAKRIVNVRFNVYGEDRKMEIRLAKEEDAAALLEIYGQYIDTTITFEYVLPSEEEFRRRIRETLMEYPYLVCEEHGKIIGYAYAHRAWERAAFQWNAELSIYLDKQCCSKGIGKNMYQMLMEILRLQGVKTVYASVTSPNPKSERLHQSLGFHFLGAYHQTGYKCNTWCDLMWFEKQIGAYEEKPSPVIPIGKLKKEELRKIFEKYQLSRERIGEEQSEKS